MDSEIIGYIAGSLIACSLLPQVVRSWRTKSTEDISLGWSVISLAGQLMWTIYGVMIMSYPLVVMSCITMVLASSILYLKLKYGMRLSQR